MGEGACPAFPDGGFSRSLQHLVGGVAMGFGRVAFPRAAQDEVWKAHARGARIKDAALKLGVDDEAARE